MNNLFSLPYVENNHFTCHGTIYYINLKEANSKSNDVLKRTSNLEFLCHGILGLYSLSYIILLERSLKL